MPSTDAIILVILGGLLTFYLARMGKKLDRHNKAADERQEKLIKQYAVEKCYSDSIGELATTTAKALKRNKTVNGDLDESLKTVETARGKRNDFYREANAKMAVEK